MSSYDFEAADWLSRQLVNLEEKAKWLAWYRGQRQHGLLGGEKSDDWTGPRRKKFDGDFDAAQRTLAQLAAAAEQARKAVDAATANAHVAAQAKRHH
ncbi:hypothetical protein [Actinacidiphila acidipaludis]|uniref:Uncharacterized protein n=1 Tax=Actinacidiphila acidipaludis TaxID=2873382 RepID=A0ABS7QHX4_9ACTN|nr:hypothetical protein [Streptomyces acidipaludis]MBY8882558.1 hypothetical protein [Streptomyces acidipaludis]